MTKVAERFEMRMVEIGRINYSDNLTIEMVDELFKTSLAMRNTELITDKEWNEINDLLIDWLTRWDLIGKYCDKYCNLVEAV